MKRLSNTEIIFALIIPLVLVLSIVNPSWLYDLIQDTGAGTGKQVPAVSFYIKSKLYSDGWIFEKCSPDFTIEFAIPALSDHALKTTSSKSVFDVFFDTYQENDFLRGVPAVSSVKGKIKFVRKEAMVKYEIDTFELRRNCQFPDGTTTSDYYDENKPGEPY